MLEKTEIESAALPPLRKMETERIKLNKSIKIRTIKRAVIIPIALGGGALEIWVASHLMTNDYHVWILILVLFCTWTVIAHVREEWQKKIKDSKASFEGKVKNYAYQEVFKAWNSTIKYVPDSAIHKDEFRKSNLHPNFSYYSGDDYCEGLLHDGRKFRFSEVVAKRSMAKFNPQKVQSNQRPLVFKGLFFIIENSIPYVGFDNHMQIVLKKKKTADKNSKQTPIKKERPKKYNEHILDADLDVFAVDKEEKKTLNSLFDRLFEIKGKNPELLRKKLSPEFCEQLNHLRVFLQHDIGITFCDNNVYFSLRQQVDFLPTTTEHNLLSEQRIQYITQNFSTVFRALENIANITSPNL